MYGAWARLPGKQELADERILGSSDFVERIIREAEIRIQRQYSGKERGRKVERLIAEECKKRKVSLTMRDDHAHTMREAVHGWHVDVA